MIRISDASDMHARREDKGMYYVDQSYLIRCIMMDINFNYKWPAYFVTELLSLCGFYEM